MYLMCFLKIWKQILSCNVLCEIHKQWLYPVIGPSITKVKFAPCHIPTMKKVKKIAKITALFPNFLYLTMKGLYIKSLHQEEREICHLRQNSDIFFASKGRLKLSIRLIPKHFAIPKAISV